MSALQPALVLGDINLIRPLGMVGVPVTLATPDPETSGARSRYCRRVLPFPNPEDLDGTVEALMAVPWPEGAQPALFYQRDHGLRVLSRSREILGQRYRFLLPPVELVEDLLDKARFLTLALRLGLQIPRTEIVAPNAGAERLVAEWDIFPCVIKPAVHSERWMSIPLPGSAMWAQKAIRVERREDLLRLWPVLKGHGSELIFQECIDGGEDRIVSFHAYVRPGGECVAWFTGRKIRTFPRSMGTSTYVEVTADPRVRDAGFEIVERLNFHGVLKIDFKEDPRDGRLHLLEINPRFNLWHYPAAAAGVNLPALVYQDLYSLEWSLSTQVRPGMRWLWLDGDFRAFREARRAGEISVGAWLRSLCARSVYEPFAWNDPMPLAAALWKRVRPKIPRWARPSQSAPTRGGSAPN